MKDGFPNTNRGETLKSMTMIWQAVKNFHVRLYPKVSYDGKKTRTQRKGSPVLESLG